MTRAREQAGEFVSQLEALGAEVLLLSTITFSEPGDPAPLDRAIRELDQFDWLIFTSQNAVRFFYHRMTRPGSPADVRNALMSHVKVAVVGPATAEAALDAGFAVDHEAKESRGEVLAAELGPKLAGKRVLLPRSDRANPTLSAGLRAAGAEVVEVVTYRTVAPESFDARVMESLRAGEVDVLTVFSPSAFHHLVEEIGLDALRRQSGKMVFAAIGPVTAEAVRKSGLRLEIEASEQSAASLASAIATHFEQRAREGVKPQ